MRFLFLLISSIFISNSIEAQCFVKIASGEQHTMAIANDSTLWGWGSNNSGECGMQPTTNLLEPTQIGSFTDWVDVDCGPYHTIALRANGDVYASGYNNQGQCGTGNTSSVYGFAKIGSDFMKVAGGKGYSSYAIKSDSTLWACGLNNGRFGDGSTGRSLELKKVDSTHAWIDIAGGFDHSIGLTSSGEVYTSGGNVKGQLGRGTNNFTSSNTRILINTVGHTIISVDAGHLLSVMLDSYGQVFTFGTNSYGKLGIGNANITEFATPYIVPGFDSNSIKKIKAGYNGVIAISDSAFYTWGKNDYNITSTAAGDNYSPYKRNLSNKPVDASMGLFAIALIGENEGVFNWGENSRGNCGNGTTNHLSSPALNNAVCGAVSCNIDSVYIDAVSLCNPLDNTYLVTVTVYYKNAPDSGKLNIGGFGKNDTFSISTSPQTETVTGIAINNTPSNLSVYFTEDINCSYSQSNAWVIPAPCSGNSINELNTKTPKIYPNPAKNKITIELEMDAKLNIISLLGEKLSSHSLVVGTNILEVESLEPGIYFLQLKQANLKEIVTIKLIKN